MLSLSKLRDFSWKLFLPVGYREPSGRGRRGLTLGLALVEERLVVLVEVFLVFGFFVLDGHARLVPGHLDFIGVGEFPNLVFALERKSMSKVLFGFAVGYDGPVAETLLVLVKETHVKFLLVF